MSKNPEISVVIPAYNEEPNIDELCSRLVKVLQGTGRTFEIIVVNDGSKDGSIPKLLQWFQKYPHNFRILDFNCNFGHHNAILAGFEHIRGEIAITLDGNIIATYDITDAGDFQEGLRTGKKLTKGTITSAVTVWESDGMLSGVVGPRN